MSVAIEIEPRPAAGGGPTAANQAAALRAVLGRADDLRLRRPDQRARDPADGDPRAARVGARGRDPDRAGLAPAPALLAAGGRLDRPPRAPAPEHDRRRRPPRGSARDDPGRLVARRADHVAAPRRRVRRRRADGLLRPLQRIVLRRARPPVAVRGREQQVLDDALALVHRGAHDRRLPRAGAHRAGRDRRRRRSRSSSPRSPCAGSGCASRRWSGATRARGRI